MTSQQAIKSTGINHPEDSGKTEIERDIARTGAALSASEVVNRFGSANAEYIKGYTGTDNETGQKFAKGLADIAKHKVNSDPAEAAKNIKQQAGFSAEVATTSRDNAEAIINQSKVRTSRSDDLQQFGRNHNVVDRVQIVDGQIIEGTQSQMKFVGNRDDLLKDIAREDGKFARYRGTRLELPSEQYQGAAEHCRDQAQKLRINAEMANQNGKPDVAAKLRREAENFDQLAFDLLDSGMTSEQAISYRLKPKIETAKDIATTSHRAGLEGAQCGAAIGGCISLLQNLFATAQGEKEVGEATKDLALDTVTAGAVGYTTAFAGSAIKSFMQQSGRHGIRTLASTTAPALIVNICISLSSSIKRYASGELTESELLAEVGEKGAGMLCSGMMAAVGQVAIPVPFVGAAIGGMIGYTLSSFFYQGALEAARGAEVSREILERTRAIETAARERIAQEQAALDTFICREMPQLKQETQQLFIFWDSASLLHADALAAAINKYAALLGKQLQFNSIAEFDDFMNSDKPFQL